jgi:hypothetical protein
VQRCLRGLPLRSFSGLKGVWYEVGRMPPQTKGASGPSVNQPQVKRYSLPERRGLQLYERISHYRLLVHSGHSRRRAGLGLDVELAEDSLTGREIQRVGIRTIAAVAENQRPQSADLERPAIAVHRLAG